MGSLGPTAMALLASKVLLLTVSVLDAMFSMPPPSPPPAALPRASLPLTVLEATISVDPFQMPPPTTAAIESDFTSQLEMTNCRVTGNTAHRLRRGKGHQPEAD